MAKNSRWLILFILTTILISCAPSTNENPKALGTISTEDLDYSPTSVTIEQTVEIPVTVEVPITVIAEQTIEILVTVVVEQTVIAEPQITPIIVPTIAIPEIIVEIPTEVQITPRNNNPYFINLLIDNSPLIPQSILFDGAYLWVGGQNRDIVVKIDPNTGEIVNTIPLAKFGVGVPDLAYDGSYIWALVNQSVIKIRAIDGIIVGTYYFEFDETGFTPQSIIYANGNIWVGGKYRDLLVRLNPISGEISQVIELGKFGVGVPDLVSNRSDVFAPVNESLIQVDGSTGEIIKTYYYNFDSTSFKPQSLAFDGVRIWAGGLNRDLVVGINLGTDAMQVLQVGKTGTGVPEIILHENNLYAIVLEYLVKTDIINVSIINQVPFIPTLISLASTGEFLWVGIEPQGILIKN